MDVLDENGRLFGYVNIIDALVVLFVAAILVAGFAFVNQSQSQNQPEPSRGTEYVEVTVENVPASVSHVVTANESDTGRPSLNTTLGRIIHVYSITTGKDTVTLKMIVAVPNGTVRVGKSVTITSTNYELSGMVTDLRDRPGPLRPDFERVTVEVLATDIPANVADDLRAGMTIRRNGRVEAEVTDLRVDPATVVVRSDDGQIYAREHPLKKDVTLTVDLRARKVRDSLRYGDTSIRLGNSLSLGFDIVTISGNVVEIQRG